MQAFVHALDSEQVAVDGQCAICIMRQDFLGKNLAELDTFLVEGVDVPQESLEHDLVLKVGKQCAKGSRCQLFANDDAGRTAVDPSITTSVPIWEFLKPMNCRGTIVFPW